VNSILCAVCSSKKVTQVRRDYEATYNGTPVRVPNTVMCECGACGERFFTPEQSRELSRQMKNRVRKQFGLLSPEEIAQIRHGLALSQEGLEQLFGLGPKVVTRWETGRVVQAKTADIALRLLAIEPRCLERLRRNLDTSRSSGTRPAKQRSERNSR
jgi:putative zinc finger/helix-turn-helix YgiT family protein